MDFGLMDFGSKSIRTESITEKKETTFQMDSVLMDFLSIRTESIYGKQIKRLKVIWRETFVITYPISTQSEG